MTGSEPPPSSGETSMRFQGHNQTKVGMCPSDWQVLKLGDLFEAKAGGDYIETKSSDVQDNRYAYPIYANGLEEKGLYGFSNYADVQAGSITVTARGTLGKAFYRDKPFVAIGRLLVLKPKVTVDARFFSEYINYGVHFAVESTGVPQLTAPQVARYSLPVPPLSEQRAIAEVLTDVDKLIGALDALIAKKRAIKQAAMQQLLTGKTRLPGFSGEWETKRLGEIADIKAGTKNNQDKDDDGEYPFFVRSATVERINSYSFDGEAILVPGEGGIGSIFHYINGSFDFHQRVYMINRFVEDVCGKFVYYSMDLQFGDHAMQNTVKATVDSLRVPTFKNFCFCLPKAVEEQIAIAEALSEMEAEIVALEHRRNKTYAIKQGMMQQLLTGRVRLVKSE